MLLICGAHCTMIATNITSEQNAAAYRWSALVNRIVSSVYLFVYLKSLQQ